MSTATLMTKPTAICNVLADVALALPTAGTAEEVLKEYTFEKGWLSRAKDRAVFEATFTTAATANAKIPRVRLGGLAGTVVAGGLSVALNDGVIIIRGSLVRNAQATGVGYSTMITGTAAAGVAHAMRAALTADWDTDLLLTITGTTASAAGDLILQGFSLDVVRAN